MVSMARFWFAVLLGAPLLAGCSTARPEWLQREDKACFKNRNFTEEIPRIYWGDPIHDPCWRYRGGRGGR